MDKNYLEEVEVPEIEDIEYPIKFTDLADDIQSEIIELTGINDWAEWDEDRQFAVAKLIRVIKGN